MSTCGQEPVCNEINGLQFFVRVLLGDAWWRAVGVDTSGAVRRLLVGKLDEFGKLDELGKDRALGRPGCDAAEYTWKS